MVKTHGFPVKIFPQLNQSINLKLHHPTKQHEPTMTGGHKKSTKSSAQSAWTAASHETTARMAFFAEVGSNFAFKKILEYYRILKQRLNRYQLISTKSEVRIWLNSMWYDALVKPALASSSLLLLFSESRPSGVSSVVLPALDQQLSIQSLLLL